MFCTQFLKKRLLLHNKKKINIIGSFTTLIRNPLPLSWLSMTISLKRSQNHWICGSIGYGTNNKTIILAYIGILVTITLRSITRRITLRNITKTSNEHVQERKINCMPSQYVNYMLSYKLQMCVGMRPYIQRTMM